MADLGQVTSQVKKPTSELLEQLPMDRLREQAQQLLALFVQQAIDKALSRVEGMTERLTDYAEHGGPGLMAALSGGQALAEGKSPVRGALSAGATQLKETIKGVLTGRGKGGGGGGKKLKVTNIVEHIDVGLPLRTTYNLWTQFQDFPSFMKKVETVDQASDEKLNWQAKVFWSRRRWESTIIEQVPDSHIVWRSQGAKGHVDGAVSFTALGPNLTRILLVLEYWPKGLFERTGNLWRAQGRRARLEFKHFRRHAMTNAILRQDEIEGWRGEIRDSEVVRTHEEALQEEKESEAEVEQTGGAAAPEELAEDREEVTEGREEVRPEDAYEEEEEEEPYSGADREEYDEDVAEEEAGYDESIEEEPDEEDTDRGRREAEVEEAEVEEEEEPAEPVVTTGRRRRR